MRYLLPPNNTLIVRGPASLRLLSGDATVLAAPLECDKRLVIRQEKQLPIEASSEVEVEILRGEKGSTFQLEGSTIPKSWRTAAQALSDVKEGKVMIIGGTDVGKSTLCTYLTNDLLMRGLRVRVIDGDIGQADIGPPTTVGSAVALDCLFSLSDLSPSGMIFVGHTSPSHVETKLTLGIRRLANVEQNILTIINTDGWVLDPEAILYKIRLIAAVQPDLVIGISTDGELQPILSGSQARSMRIEAARDVLSRSRSDRRELRIAGYKRFLEGGTVRTLQRRTIRIGTPKGVRDLQNPDLRNLIVGLLNNEGFLLQIGIFLSADRDMLRIHTRSLEGTYEIELGYVKLSTDGVELGYLES